MCNSHNGNNNSPEAGDFVHLHVHSEFSALDGINRVNEYPEHAKSMGQVAVSMTDHGNMAGSYTFFKECNKAGVKPLIGMEAYYTLNDRTAKGKDEYGKAYYHLVLLAKNNEGLHNMFKLTSESYTSGMYYKPRLDDELLGQYGKGVIATSSCLGSAASRHILNNEMDKAERLILHHQKMFDDFLIELQLHEAREQQIVNQGLIQIAQKYDLPMILSNDCHYLHEDDKEVHEQALCISTNAKMAMPKWDPERKSDEDLIGPDGKKMRTRFSFGDIDVHMAHRDWMWERAQKQGIPYDAIKNTRYVADMIDAQSYFGNTINRYPKMLGISSEREAAEVLYNKAKHMLIDKMNGNIPEKYIQRFLYEHKVLKRMGYCNYLLIMEDNMKISADVGVWTGPGRGSAGGSLIAYALGITKVEPVKYGLLFERFLNEGRAANVKVFDAEMIMQIENAQKPKGYVHCNHGVHASTCKHHH